MAIKPFTVKRSDLKKSAKLMDEQKEQQQKELFISNKTLPDKKALNQRYDYRYV